MFQYNPVTQNKSGEIYANNIMYGAKVESEAKQQAAAMNAQAQQQMVSDIGGALVGLASMYAESSKDKKGEKDKFTGMYNFMSEKNMISPSAQTALDSFVQRKDYAGANAYIAPYLAELDFGRKSMLAGRSGFFDGSGQWQMAMPAQAVNPPNKEGYTYGGR